MSWFTQIIDWVTRWLIAPQGKRRTALRRILVTSALLALVLIHPFEQSAFAFSGQSRAWPGLDGISIYRDDTGKPLWFSDAELEKHAVHKETPRWPASIRTTGCIEVEVLIDDQGNVVNTRVPHGHPMLRYIASEAAKRWKFEPWRQSGHRVFAVGRLLFNYSPTPEP
jgi:hypothetical protein